MGKILVLLLIVLLCASSLVIAVKPPLAEAEQLVGLITIQGDGSVVPQTDYIKQEGNVYYLTQSLSSHRLDINCSNIVLDGQGYTINGSNHFVLGGNGITLDSINNVTIKDVIVVGYYEPSIHITNCSGVNISRVQTDAKPTIVVDISGCIWLEQSGNNAISNSLTGIRLQSGSNNKIFNNSLYLDTLSSGNFYYNNNMYVHYASNGFRFPIIGDGSINSWDNGSIGNYWSDYNGSGVYVIDENNIDHYPLTNPVDINAQTPTSTPTPTPFLPPRNPPHLELLDYLLLISVILAVIIAVSVLFFRRHRKTISQNKPNV
jgi:parallel beta-helix repeat protein